jgi:hypothetical protein
MNEIVVARYNENIDWLKFFDSKKTIYNKGDEIDVDCVKLQNIGRESHTYLHHIISRYNSLSNVTIFTQGDPFPHCSDFIDKTHLIIQEGLDKPFQNLCSWVLQVDNLQCRCWPYHCWSNLLPEVAHSLFGEDFNHPIWFGAGAIFAVTKEAIHRHPIEFYEKAIRFHDTDIDGYAHAFERLWPTIFEGLP